MKTTTTPTTTTLYHERQAFGRQLCACHALNNLLQARRFAPADLFRASRALGAGAAQATLFFGNFDVNVLQAAALEAGLDLRYFDARKAGERDGPLDVLLREGGGGGVASGNNDGDDDEEEDASGGAPLSIAGLLLNMPSRSLWGRLRGARHWLSLVPVDNGWANLDSMLERPQRLGGAEEAAAFLRACLLDEQGGGTLLVARRQPSRVAAGATAEAAAEAAAARSDG